MAKYHAYVLAIWLRLESPFAAPELLEQLQEHLEAEYQIYKIEAIEDSEYDAENQTTVSLQLQMTFDETQMEDNEPTDQAIADLDMELTTHLLAKFQIAYLEIMDDALTSFWLDKWEE